MVCDAKVAATAPAAQAATETFAPASCASALLSAPLQALDRVKGLGLRSDWPVSGGGGRGHGTRVVVVVVVGR